MTDNKNVLQVLKGFSNLTDMERIILEREINDFNSKSYLGQIEAKSNVTMKLRASLGPTNDNSCTCCGKS